ncbi:glucose-6-phosphate isomerase, cytosolic 1-like [Bidens hawaiensis]|uniref:glucose-6-phosphate isomerase, cytosolic 1-like n=1 Tax=Bidens hawaiensis TaxID=980011 RepID=UPI0040496C91
MNKTIKVTIVKVEQQDLYEEKPLLLKEAESSMVDILKLAAIFSVYIPLQINSTENKSMLHVALRASKDTTINSDGKNVVPDVWQVLDKIHQFSDKVRNESWVGATGKALTNVIAIGIGGSFFGPLFVHTALQADPGASKLAGGRQLRFLANVDPVDVARNISGLNPETTLVVVSKTFTTAGRMLNAWTLREWISSAPLMSQAVSKHMVAVSTNLKVLFFTVF